MKVDAKLLASVQDYNVITELTRRQIEANMFARFNRIILKFRVQFDTGTRNMLIGHEGSSMDRNNVNRDQIEKTQ